MRNFPLFILAALLFVAPLSYASQSKDDAVLLRSGLIQANPEAFAKMPQTKASGQHQQWAQDLANISRQTLQSQYDEKRAAAQAALEPAEEVHILVTFGPSGNPERLRGLMRALVGEDVTLAVRGLPAGMTRIDELVLAMGQLGQGISNAPGMILDPRLFRHTGASGAPTILVTKDGKPQLWAAGVTDPQWIMERYEKGDRGDLGIHGSTEAIAEKDLTQEIAERIAKVDWEAKKAQAAKRYWGHQRFLDLPVATEPRAVEFTLEYQIQKDIYGSEGEVLARAGERINPLSRVAGQFYLVIFDASDPAQLKAARAIGQAAPEGKRLKYLATRMDTGEDGWEEKVRIEDYLDAPLYFVNQEQIERLRVQNIPAIVEAAGQSIRVTEIPPQRLP